MFEKLSERLQGVVNSLRGRGKLTESNIEEAVRAVRIALLEADVHINVVKDVLEGVKVKALGQEVMKSLTPDQHFIKILHEEMVRVLGEGQSHLAFPSLPPGILMLVGLQGSGKTTTAAKIARYFLKEGHSALLVPADVYRPAAQQQLKILAGQVGVFFYDPMGETDPVSMCEKAVADAKKRGIHRVIIDTAGRLHIDEKLMTELEDICRRVNPAERLYVADAMAGQSAVQTAKTFHEKVSLTGVVLTKADGDARGGVVLSVKATTGLPVKMVGTGEKTDAIELFYPERMASRILGMGDVLSLIEKAQEVVDIKEAEQTAKRLQKGDFSLNDLREQFRQIKKMGPLDQIVGMIPGLSSMGNLPKPDVDENQIKRMEAILDSMTIEERSKHKILNGSRRRRIAQGSGTTVAEVNRLIQQYLEMKKMVEKMKKGGMKSILRNLRGRLQ
jgi:signal recognition particle subunit SRP54